MAAKDRTVITEKRSDVGSFSYGLAPHTFPFFCREEDQGPREESAIPSQVNGLVREMIARWEKGRPQTPSTVTHGVPWNA